MINGQSNLLADTHNFIFTEYLLNIFYSEICVQGGYTTREEQCGSGHLLIFIKIEVQKIWKNEFYSQLSQSNRFFVLRSIQSIISD